MKTPALIFSFLLCVASLADAAGITKPFWRSDGSAVTEGSTFLRPGPGGIRFSKPSGTLWKGSLSKTGVGVIVDDERAPTFSGFSTPDMGFPDLGVGDYTVVIRLVGISGSAKTWHFSVRPPETQPPVDQPVDGGNDNKPTDPLPPFAFTLQPTAHQSVRAGGSVTFQSVAPGATSWQWQGPRGKIDDATNSTLVLGFVEPGDAGTYRVVASDDLGNTITSADATLIVTVDAVVFTEHPKDVTAKMGGLVTFRANATGARSFVWYGPKGALADKTTPTLTLGFVTPEDRGAYRVSAFDAAGKEYSSATAMLTVETTPPRIIKQPQGVTVDAGKGFTLAVKSEDATDTYQWEKDGVEQDGDTSAKFKRATATADDAGKYVCIVSNEDSEVRSVAVTVVVRQPVVFRAGKFAGLFSVADGASHESSGAIKLNATNTGSFTGKAQIGSTRYAFTGAFAEDGAATCQASASAPGAVPLQIALSWSADERIVGRVTAADWDAEVLMDQAVYSAAEPCPLAGSIFVRYQQFEKPQKLSDSYQNLRKTL